MLKVVEALAETIMVKRVGFVAPAESAVADARVLNMILRYDPERDATEWACGPKQDHSSSSRIEFSIAQPEHVGSERDS